MEGIKISAISIKVSNFNIIVLVLLTGHLWTIAESKTREDILSATLAQIKKYILLHFFVWYLFDLTIDEVRRLARFERGLAGWEAGTLSLSHTTPPEQLLFFVASDNGQNSSFCEMGPLKFGVLLPFRGRNNINNNCNHCISNNNIINVGCNNYPSTRTIKRSQSINLRMGITRMPAALSVIGSWRTLWPLKELEVFTVW